MAGFSAFFSYIMVTIADFLQAEPIKYLWYMLICMLIVDLLFELIGLRRKGGKA